MKISQLISREVERRQRIGRNGALKKKKKLKSVPIEQRCNSCGSPKDEFSLTTLYNKDNNAAYRLCDECYNNSGDLIRNRFFYREI